MIGGVVSVAAAGKFANGAKTFAFMQVPNGGIVVGDWGPLSGSPYWRLRIGDYRAICAIEKDELVLLVLKVGPRGGIYK